MTLTQQWLYLNLTRNNFYILFLAKGIVSFRQIISSRLYVRLKGINHSLAEHFEIPVNKPNAERRQRRGVLITARGVTRLDGARGKKQVWHPHVQTCGLLEANVLHWSTCDIIRTFQRPPQWFGSLIVGRRQGNCAPCTPVVAPLITVRSDAPQQTIGRSSNQRHTGNLGGGHNFQFHRFCATVSKTNRKVLQGDDSATCPNISVGFSWNFLNLALIFPPPRRPIALTQKLWQNTSYLQFGGLNNWFYAVITIFAQHLNICSSKLGHDGAICPHLAVREAAVTDGCVVLILLLQLKTRRQLTLVTRRQIWYG